MERIPNGKYTKEFRVEAVKLATEGELSSVLNYKLVNDVLNFINYLLFRKLVTI